MERVFFTIDAQLKDILNQYKGKGHVTLNVRFHDGRIVGYQIETFKEISPSGDEIVHSGAGNQGQFTFLNLAAAQVYPKYGTIAFDLLFQNGVVIWYKIKNAARYLCTDVEKNHCGTPFPRKQSGVI
jgi:hypothetical protein